MAENITSLYDIYNRANDAGKATDIQSNDLFYMQRGTGSDRDKCIKGSDIKASTGLVIVSSYSESNPVDIPEPLLQKLYNSDTINFDDTTVSGNKKIVAELRTNSVDTAHLKSNSVSTAKIAEGAVTESKIALNSIQEQAIKDGAVTTGKLGNGSVSTDKIQNSAVNGAKLDSSVIDVQYDDVDIDFGNDIVDIQAGTFDHKVHQFSGVGERGLIDITLYVSGVQVSYMTDVKFEIRKSDSPNAESTWDVGTIPDDEIISRRMVVKNGVSSAANYELHLVGKLTNSVPSGISGFLACRADIRGISIA